jgi:hypothetical protein
VPFDSVIRSMRCPERIILKSVSAQGTHAALGAALPVVAGIDLTATDAMTASVRKVFRLPGKVNQMDAGDVISRCQLRLHLELRVIHPSAGRWVLDEMHRVRLMCLRS